MEENVIQINSGITINVIVSVKNVIYVKKIMFGILLHIAVKMRNIMDDSAIMCDEVIESNNEDSEAKSNDEKRKTLPTNVNEKSNL